MFSDSCNSCYSSKCIICSRPVQNHWQNNCFIYPVHQYLGELEGVITVSVQNNNMHIQDLSFSKCCNDPCYCISVAYTDT
jgi:transcriptional regulator of acetoin/glycerol metabolism